MAENDFSPKQMFHFSKIVFGSSLMTDLKILTKPTELFSPTRDSTEGTISCSHLLPRRAPHNPFMAAQYPHLQPQPQPSQGLRLKTPGSFCFLSFPDTTRHAGLIPSDPQMLLHPRSSITLPSCQILSPPEALLSQSWLCLGNISLASFQALLPTFNCLFAVHWLWGPAGA